MKTLISILIMLAILSRYNSTNAQPDNQGPVLVVGAKAPAISAFKWIKGKPLTEFEKGKLYVIEFGATWCTPCDAAIPELTALADKYKNEASVVSIFVMEQNDDPTNNLNPSYLTRVERYIAKRQERIHYAVGVDNPQKTMESTWLKASGKIGVPYTFIIDKEGMIAWIGSDLKPVDEMLKTISSNTYDLEKVIKLKTNQDALKPPYDQTKLLLVDGNGGTEKDILFRSLLSKFDGTNVANQEFIENYRWVPSDHEYHARKDRVQVVGLSIAQLYFLAYADTTFNVIHGRNRKDQYPDTVKNPHHKNSYGRYWHKPVLEVNDLSPFNWSHNGPANRFNYSLKLPPGTGTAKFLQTLMQQDLKMYFGYNTEVETRMMPYWSLTAPDKSKAIAILRSRTPNGKFNLIGNEGPYVFTNAILRDIIWMLGANYGYGSFDYGKVDPSEQAAFIDETGIKETIDFTFDRSMSFSEMKAYLKGNGLDVIKREKPMKVVVIRDTPK
jgi:thiol-disulfide isomerase/thioredoxin